jgi:glycerol-3-phosphate acyltransferase PlsY
MAPFIIALTPGLTGGAGFSLPLRLAALALGSYLIGSIPFGVVIGRAWSGVDIREYGSGNIGFTNAFRVLGWKPASVVLIADVLKGFLPVFVARRVLAGGGLTSLDLWLLPIALAPILGHCFSPFLRFRGGRAISTTLGVLLGLAPGAGLCSLGVWLIAVAITRYVSVASLLAAVAVPVTVALTGSRWELIAFWSAVAALVIWRHRPNVTRLLAGTETKLGQRVGVEEEGKRGRA